MRIRLLRTSCLDAFQICEDIETEIVDIVAPFEDGEEMAVRPGEKAPHSLIVFRKEETAPIPHISVESCGAAHDVEFRGIAQGFFKGFEEAVPLGGGDIPESNAGGRPSLCLPCRSRSEGRYPR